VSHCSRLKLRAVASLIVVPLLFGFGTQSAEAAQARVSASYEVLGKTNVGAGIKILLRFRLTNGGPGPVYLEKILLWDFAEPPNGGPCAPAIEIPAGTSQETTQQFVIPRVQFVQWQRGLRPRVVLGLRTARGEKITQAIRLDRIALRKGE